MLKDNEKNNKVYIVLCGEGRNEANGVAITYHLKDGLVTYKIDQIYFTYNGDDQLVNPISLIGDQTAI